MIKKSLFIEMVWIMLIFLLLFIANGKKNRKFERYCIQNQDSFSLSCILLTELIPVICWEQLLRVGLHNKNIVFVIFWDLRDSLYLWEALEVIHKVGRKDLMMEDSIMSYRENTELWDMRFVG